MIISCWKTCSSGFAMRLDHATLKCSPQSLCRVSSCWKKGSRQAPQPRQGELIVKPWSKIELHFHDPQTGHSYAALSSLELGTEPNVRACMRQDFHIGSRLQGSAWNPATRNQPQVAKADSMRVTCHAWQSPHDCLAYRHTPQLCCGKTSRMFL